MPIYWGDESSAWVDRRGEFYRVYGMEHRGVKVLLMILRNEAEATEQARRWQARLAANPQARMFWDARLNYISDVDLP